MLPHELADDLCSLRPNVDRLCVTVEIPPQGEPSFYRSVIRSNERLTYGQAQRREASELILDQLALNDELAATLRARRFARGALQVQSPEAVFSFDGEAASPTRGSKGEPHAHMLVEELMILANECVGAFLSSRNRPALYRVHERPDPKAVENLIAKLADLGVPTPPVPSPLTPQLAATVAGEASKLVTTYTAQSGRGKEAFPSLVLRALKQARYDPKNLGHAGLASSAYCHFTSPIRRYPDLIVHRALLRELGQSDDPLPEDLQHLAEHTSERERAAAQVEYAADAICLVVAARAAPVRARLGREVGGGDHRPDRLRALRAVRRGVRRLPAGAPAARRVLPAERPGDGDVRPDDGPHLPSRRRTFRPRRAHFSQRGQGGAHAGVI